MIALDRRKARRITHLLDNLRKPGLLRVIVFNPARLPAGINYQAVGNPEMHLVLYQSTIGKVLNGVLLKVIRSWQECHLLQSFNESSITKASDSR
jgi:hypothetical protein